MARTLKTSRILKTSLISFISFLLVSVNGNAESELNDFRPIENLSKQESFNLTDENSKPTTVDESYIVLNKSIRSEETSSYSPSSHIHIHKIHDHISALPKGNENKARRLDAVSNVTEMSQENHKGHAFLDDQEESYATDVEIKYTDHTTVHYDGISDKNMELGSMNHDDIVHKNMDHDGMVHDSVVLQNTDHDDMVHKDMNHGGMAHKNMNHDVMTHKNMKHDGMDHDVMTHKNMKHDGMDHDVMTHKNMKHDGMDHDGMDHNVMNHDGMNHDGMNHGRMNHDGMVHDGVVLQNTDHDGMAHKDMTIMAHKDMSHVGMDHKNMDHDGMDHNHDHSKMDMNHTGSHMMMYFHTGVQETVLFKEWKITTVGGMIGSIIGIFLFGMLYEGLKYFREHLFKQYVSSIQFSTVAVTGESGRVTQVHKVERHVMMSWPHAIQTSLHVIQIVMSYFLMLVFMTYNVWLCLSIVLGAGAGYFVFGWKKASVVDITEHCH